MPAADLNEKNAHKGARYSIIDSIIDDTTGETFENVVLLDTNLFNGIKPRNWASRFRNYVMKNLINKQISVFDENGNPEIIEFAKPNERVTKDGFDHSHKVISKLERKTDNNSRLVIVHSEEIIKTADELKYNSEHNHQWLDENGWEYRTAYVQDIKGNIYSVTLNIAKAKDGRNILYDVNNIKKVGHGVVPSNANSKRGSHINPDFKPTIPHLSEKSKQKFSVNDIIDEEFDDDAEQAMWDDFLAESGGAASRESVFDSGMIYNSFLYAIIL